MTENSIAGYPQADIHPEPENVKAFKAWHVAHEAMTAPMQPEETPESALVLATAEEDAWETWRQVASDHLLPEPGRQLGILYPEDVLR
jgi:hypothetical protein